MVRKGTYDLPTGETVVVWPSRRKQRGEREIAFLKGGPFRGPAIWSLSKVRRLVMGAKRRDMRRRKK
jgi:hypothetical protein